MHSLQQLRPRKNALLRVKPSLCQQQTTWTNTRARKRSRNFPSINAGRLKTSAKTYNASRRVTSRPISVGPHDPSALQQTYRNHSIHPSYNSPSSTPPTRASTPSDTSFNNQKASYAQAAKKPAQKTPKRPTTAPQKVAPTKAAPKKATPDDRLFVELPEEHPARITSSYALTKDLRGALGEAGKFIKELHPTKTGIAVCPRMPDRLWRL